MAWHDLEQVTAGELLPGLFDHHGVPARNRARRKINILGAGNGVARRSAARRLLGRPRQASSAASLGLEVVAEPGGCLPLAVHHPDLIWQMHDQVTGAGIAFQPLAHRLELEREVIAERPVEPQVRVRPGEGGHDLPQRGEHCGLPAALLLGEDLVGRRPP